MEFPDDYAHRMNLFADRREANGKAKGGRHGVGEEIMGWNWRRAGRAAALAIAAVTLTWGLASDDIGAHAAGAGPDATFADLQGTDFAAIDVDRGTAILMYHRFGEDDHPCTNIRLEQFEAHLEELTSGRYTVLPVPTILDALSTGAWLPPHTVGLTIDDAYLSVYEEAWPRLRAHDLPFTLFVSTKPIDEGYGAMMTWSQVRELAASPLVTIGNHTETHAHLPLLDETGQRMEINYASNRFRIELGQVPDLFAYPYGEFDDSALDLVSRNGFRAAFGQHSGVLGEASPIFRLPRFALNERYGAMDRFRLAINALPLPVRDVRPTSSVVTPSGNPPEMAFTVHESVGPLDALSCYRAGARLETTVSDDRRVSVRIDAPFAEGHTRINCTMPAGDGRWRWHGRQFYVAPQDSAGKS